MIEDLFPMIIATVIGLVIQFLLIKTAILVALKEFAQKNAKTKEKELQMMEIITKKVGGSKELLEKFYLKELNEKYEANKKSYMNFYIGDAKTQMLDKLDAEYKQERQEIEEQFFS